MERASTRRDQTKSRLRSAAVAAAILLTTLLTGVAAQSGASSAQAVERGRGPSPRSAALTFSGPLGSPFYDWKVIDRATFSGDTDDLIYQRVGLDDSGNVAYLADTAGAEHVWFSTKDNPAPTRVEFGPFSAGAVEASPGVVMNDRDQIATAFQVVNTGTGDSWHVQRLRPDQSGADLADGGASPPFVQIDRTPAIDASGNVIFTGIPYAGSKPGQEDVFSPKSFISTPQPLTAFNTISPTVLQSPATTSVDAAGDVLVPVNDSKGIVSELRKYSPTLTAYTTIAGRSGSGAVCGGPMARIGARPSMSSDGTVIAFSAENPSGQRGVYACYQDTTASGPATWQTVRVAGGGNTDDFGYTHDSQAITTSFTDGDLDSSVDVVREAASLTSDRSIAQSSMTVEFAAHPMCAWAAGRVCPADPSDTHTISPDRGIWSAELVPQAGTPSPLDIPGPVTVHVRRPWPVLQVGDQVNGFTVTSLDTRTPASTDSALWFSMAADIVGGKSDANEAGNHYTAVAVQVTKGGEAGQLLLRGTHQDTDGDGLLDHWEGSGHGIDVTGEGAPTITLPDSDPLHRDVYLHLDAMSQPTPPIPGTMAPPQAALDEVTGAFNGAPVTNPDGLDGIHLHLDRAYQSARVAYSPYVRVNLDEQAGPAGTPTLKDMRDAHLAAGDPAKTAAAELAYRYVLFGDENSDGYAPGKPEPAVGETEGEASLATTAADSSFAWGGQSLLISLGHPAAPLFSANPLSTDLFAVDLMHELGHLLGLRHGGSDNLNCKPNYQSVMNYGYIDNTVAPFLLDYSRTLLSTLDESSLDETHGVGKPVAGEVIYGRGGVLEHSLPDGAGGLNWNGNGSSTETGYNQALANLPTLNTDCTNSVLTNLTGYNDWPNLRYAPMWGMSERGEGALSQASPPPELPSDEWLKNWKAGDIDSDGVTNASDNCAFVSNPAQADGDGNGVGDACETTAGMANTSAPEGDAGQTGAMAFTVRLSGRATTSPVTVNYVTADLTALAGRDYTSTTGTLSIPAGSKAGTIRVKLVGNNTVNDDRQFVVRMTGAVGAGVSVPSYAVGTITDDDPYLPPSLSIGTAITASASLTASTTARVPVTIDHASRRAVSVSYATADGTAGAGQDYTASTGKLTIPAGQVSGEVQIPILPAVYPHAPRSFSVAFTKAVNAHLNSPSTAEVTITTPQAPGSPVVSAVAGDRRVTLSWTAPDPGTAPITAYTLYRGTAAGAETRLATAAPDSLSYADTAVANGTTYYYRVTATSAVGEGPPSNEVSAKPAAATVPGQPTLTVSAAAGVVHLTWTRPAQGGAPISAFRVLRSTDTGSEGLLVALSPSTTTYADSAVTNGTGYFYQVAASNSYGAGTPSTEKPATPAAPASAPKLTAMSENAAVQLRWEAPTSTAGLAVTGWTIWRSTTSGAETSLATTAGTALSYLDTSAANATTYFYRVSATTSAGAGAQSVERNATPSAIAPPRIYVPDVSATAPDANGQSTLTFPVSLSTPATGVVTVHAVTGNGSAQPGSDYVPVDTTVTFPAGATTENIVVPIIGAGLNGDGTYQGAVTFPLTLDSVTGGAQIARSPAVGTILSHTAAPAISIADLSVNENVGTAQFKVSLSKPSAVDTTVKYLTRDGSALAGTNYTSSAGTLTLPAGATTSTITVPIINTNGVGTARTFQVVLFKPTGASLTRDIAHASIILTSNGQAACQAPTIHWVGAPTSDGDWSDAANWSPSRVPVSTDVVCIDTGIGVTVNQAAAVAALGTTEPLTIKGRLQLTSTTRSSQLGADTLLDGRSNAELDVAGTLEITQGTFSMGEPNVAPVNMNGTSVMGGSGTVFVHQGAMIKTWGGVCASRFTTEAQTHLYGCLSITPSVRNDGRFVLASGSLFRDSSASFTNNGTLELQDSAGDEGAGSIAGGCLGLNVTPCSDFILSSPGAIESDAGAGAGQLARLTLAATGSVHVAGQLQIIQPADSTLGGTWAVDAGAVLFFDAALDGSGTLTLAPTASMSGKGLVQLGQNSTADTLDLKGSFTVAALSVSGVLTTHSSLTLTSLTFNHGSIQGSGGLTVAAGGTASWSSGTYAATGGLTISGSDGTSPAGTLTWQGGTWASTGTLTIAAGVTVSIPGGNPTISAGVIANNGRINWSGGVAQGLGGTFTNAGTITFSTPSPANPPILQDVSDGSFAFVNLGAIRATGNPTTFAGADLAGFKSGTGSITITSGELTLRPAGGTTAPLGGGASVSAGAVLNLSSSGVSVTVPGSFILPTGKSLSGAGALWLGSGVAFGGSAAGLEIAGADALSELRVSSEGAGTPLVLDTALSLTSFNVAMGGSTLSGPGNVVLNSGTVGSLSGAVQTSGTLTVQSGASLTSFASLGGTGTVLVAPGGHLTMSGGSLADARVITNKGTLDWTGLVFATGGTLANTAGATITSSGGNQFNDIGLKATVGGAPTVSNAGAIVANGPGRAEFDGYLGGPGALTVAPDSFLALRPAPATQAILTGGASVATNGMLDLDATFGSPTTFGSFLVPAGATLLGSGSLGIAEIGSDANVEIAGHDNLPGLDIRIMQSVHPIKLDTDVALTTFNDLSGPGSIDGPGNITLVPGGTGTLGGNLFGSGLFTVGSGAHLAWNASATMSGTGSTVFAPGSLIAAAGGALDGTRAVTNHGAITVTGLVALNSGTLTNASDGSITVSGGNGPNPRGFSASSGKTGVLTNLGALSGADTTEVDGFAGGSGQVEATSGTLTMRPPAGVTAQFGGGLTVDSGADVTLESTIGDVTHLEGYVLPAGAALSGGGQVELNPSNQQPPTLTLNGATSIGGSLSNNGVLALGTKAATIGGGYTQTSTARITTTLASRTAFGHVAAQGGATLDSGAGVQIALGGTYVPPLNTAFPLVTGSSVTGNLTVTGAPTGETYTAAGGTVTRTS